MRVATREELEEVLAKRRIVVCHSTIILLSMVYQVPMVELSVVVALAGCEPEEVSVYLAPYSDRRDGPETMADYLNGRRRFFPMVAGGVPKMINRDSIVWVKFEKLPHIVDMEITIIE